MVRFRIPPNSSIKYLSLPDSVSNSKHPKHPEAIRLRVTLLITFLKILVSPRLSRDTVLASDSTIQVDIVIGLKIVSFLQP